eukprot:3870790-Prymnesium_polylepis.1
MIPAVTEQHEAHMNAVWASAIARNRSTNTRSEGSRSARQTAANSRTMSASYLGKRAHHRALAARAGVYEEPTHDAVSTKPTPPGSRRATVPAVVPGLETPGPTHAGFVQRQSDPALQLPAETATVRATHKLA